MKKICYTEKQSKETHVKDIVFFIRKNRFPSKISVKRKGKTVIEVLGLFESNKNTVISRSKLIMSTLC